MAIQQQPIAYISKPIDNSWVVSGAECYAQFPDDVKRPLEIIYPDHMPVDFYVGAAHAAEASAVGARICYVIHTRLATDEFIEIVNALAASIHEKGL